MISTSFSRRLLTSSRRRWSRLATDAVPASSTPPCSTLTRCFSFAAPSKDENGANRQSDLYTTPIPMASFLVYNQRRLFSATSSNNDSKTEESDSSLRERARAAGDRARAGASRARKAGAKGARTAGDMLRRYGPVFLGTYFSIYMTTLASLFAGVDSGLLDPVTIFEYISSPAEGGEETKTTVALVVEYMDHYSLTRPYTGFVENNPHFANLACAWIAVKFTEPVRLGLTLAVVPRLARHFGFVKVLKDPDGDEIEVRHDEIEEVVEQFQDEASKIEEEEEAAKYEKKKEEDISKTK